MGSLYQPQPHSQAPLLCLILLDSSHFFSELWKAILHSVPSCPTTTHATQPRAHVLGHGNTDVCLYPIEAIVVLHAVKRTRTHTVPGAQPCLCTLGRETRTHRCLHTDSQVGEGHTCMDMSTEVMNTEAPHTHRHRPARDTGRTMKIAPVSPSTPHSLVRL